MLLHEQEWPGSREFFTYPHPLKGFRSEIFPSFLSSIEWHGLTDPPKLWGLGRERGTPPLTPEPAAVFLSTSLLTYTKRISPNDLLTHCTVSQQFCLGSSPACLIGIPLSLLYSLRENGSQPLPPDVCGHSLPLTLWLFPSAAPVSPASSETLLSPPSTIHPMYLAKKQPKPFGAGVEGATEAACKLVVTAISLDISLLIQMASW